jgi:putative transposase
VYCAVVLDVFSRRVVGWSIDSTQNAALVTNALGIAIGQRNPQRRDSDPLGPGQPGQYLAIRYTERLAEVGVVNSVGSRGDCYDALAESIIGLYKTELVRNRGPCRGLDDLEFATLEWVDWFNHRRLFHHELGRIPPGEFEDRYYRQNDSPNPGETHATEPV